VKRTLLLLVVSLLALSLSAAPAIADGNPLCPPNLGCPK
jgi:hypothetical protein